MVLPKYIIEMKYIVLIIATILGLSSCKVTEQTIEISKAPCSKVSQYPTLPGYQYFTVEMFDSLKANLGSLNFFNTEEIHFNLKEESTEIVFENGMAIADREKDGWDVQLCKALPGVLDHVDGDRNLVIRWKGKNNRLLFIPTGNNKKDKFKFVGYVGTDPDGTEYTEAIPSIFSYLAFIFKGRGGDDELEDDILEGIPIGSGPK